ncbi:MAG: histidinol dehydrogenase [Thermosphaera sp.]
MIKVWRLKEIDRETKNRIMARSAIDIESVKSKVMKIIEDVRDRGDKAIIDFYRDFFGREVLTQDNLRVTEDEIRKAYEKVNNDLIEALEIARKNIEVFHKSQLPKEIWFTEVVSGVLVGQIWRPIDSVGIYVPGGKADYPSTALMLAVPAKVVKVPRIVAVTPPKPDGSVSPATLVALDLAGVREIYRVGGAHAIAALAYGTQTIKRVRKVVGPGNIWVAAAKHLLKGIVDIEFIAGPSEVLILALDDAEPEYIVRDLIAQAEHDQLASAVLVTTSPKLASKVVTRLEELLHEVPRNEIVKEALSNYGAIIIADDLDEALEFVNEYAPEHLEILTNDVSRALNILSKVRNAGSIFLGNNTPVAMGDYITGANHTLPTGGNAATRGGLSVFDYIKIIDVQIVNEEGIKKLGPHAIRIAISEGLYNHAESIKARLSRTN